MEGETDQQKYAQGSAFMSIRVRFRVFSCACVCMRAYSNIKRRQSSLERARARERAEILLCRCAQIYCVL